MKSFRFLNIAVAIGMLATMSFAQIGKGKPSSPPSNPPGNSGGSKEQGPKSSPPDKGPSKSPPVSTPPTQGPTKQPPISNPPSPGPGKQPPISSPPTSNPPYQGPPRNSGNGTGKGNGNSTDPGPRGNSQGQLGNLGSSNGQGPTKQPPVREPRIVKNPNGGSYNGSINNLTSKGDDRKTKPQSIGSIPGTVRGGGSLQNQVIREERIRRNRDCRTGYYHYDPFWRDDWFWSSSYIFNPFNNTRCVVSPWYYYPSLPGYLNYNSITIIQIGADRFQGNYYGFKRSNYWNNSYERRSDLDYAVDDLIWSFENGDRRSLSRLIPSRGNVDIYLENQYDYSLNADEFYRLMLDVIFNTETRRYEIVSVKTSRDQAEVVARHDSIDPWGRNLSVYHWYRLEQDRRGYVITKFGTSSRDW